jgi:alpha-beta hydrolase superfamily lysophospholipase
MPVLAAPAPTVRTRDGLDLVVRHWPTATPRGRLVIVHGLGEHIGRYEHVGAHLASRGWDVVGYDQRGHGRSPGKRGALRDADDLLADLTAVLDAVRPAATVPFVLFGHSMGGLVAAQFVAESRRPVDALVLSSPALDAGLGLAQRLQLAIGLALVPDLAMGNQLDATKISHDPEVVRRYQTDPLVHDRVTARLAKSLVDGGAAVLAHAARWSVPTLLLWAGSDRLVSPAGSAAFAAAAPASVVTAQRFDALYHEILNERDAGPVFAALDAWLDPRRGAA